MAGGKDATAEEMEESVEKLSVAEGRRLLERGLVEFLLSHFRTGQVPAMLSSSSGWFSQLAKEINSAPLNTQLRRELTEATSPQPK